MKRFLLAVLFFAVLTALWEWAFRAKISSPGTLHSSQQVAEYVLEENISHRWHSFSGYRHYHAPVADWLCHRPYWWFYLSRVINGALGTFSRSSGALALGLQTLPSVCWDPLALLWFGQTEAAMLFVVVMGTLSFRIGGIATDTGVRHVPRFPAGRAHHGIKAFAHLAKSDLTRSPALYC